MKMKKFAVLFLLLALLTSCFSSCGNKPNDENTVPFVTETAATAENNTEETSSGTKTETNANPSDGESEKETEKDVKSSERETEKTTAPVVEPVMNTDGRRSFYGERDENAKTFTGLKSLPLNTFPSVRFENTKNLSVKTINHSFGVAKGGKPHQISVNNQKFFDDGKYDAVCLDEKTTEKVLYLTFDCGYENGYTAKILDTLRDKNVKAAFFCTMPEMAENHDIIARMINEGHTVGNHSVHHPDFSSLSREKMYEEVKGFDDYIREHFGYSSLYFRYPQGKYSESSLDLLNSMGYKCVFWSLAYADWDLKAQKGGAYAKETVVSRLHPGAVILLHAVSPDNAAALGDIIDEAREQGYRFLSLDEMKS